MRTRSSRSDTKVAALNAKAPVSRKAKPASKPDTKLVFFLAQQTIERWQAAAQALSAKNARNVPEEAESEVILGLGQIDALAARVQPLLRSKDLAVRFEAEEVLHLCEQTAAALSRARPVIMDGFQRPLRSATEIQAKLTAKLGKKRRSARTAFLSAATAQ